MSFRKAFSSSTRRATDWNQHADFYRFTRGRFVCKEAEQMAQRQIRFDMNALCRVAGQKTGTKCVNVEKCADGMYNKAFLLSMDNKQQMIAKVPNPNAGMPRLTTASEVATMDFMRNVLGTPAPRVIAWSASDQNEAEAEYIIMEKAEGVQLATVWPTMDSTQKVQIVRELVRHQQEWSKLSFNKIGSLYYRNDLPPTDHAAPLYIDQGSGESVVDSRFAIGPITSRSWTDSGRASLDCDRGPWSSTETHKRAEIERDMKAVDTVERLPQPPIMLCGPGMFQPDRQKKLHAGKVALEILPHVLPTGKMATSFNMWHDDLHSENIFVRGENPSEILAVIDWQSTCIAPMFDHAIFPAYLDYDEPPLRGLKRPSPPDLPQDTSDADRSAAWSLFEAQTFAVGFKHLLKKAIEPAFDALMFQESDAYQVINASQSILDNSEAYFLACIAALDGEPVRFTLAERTQIEEDIEKARVSAHTMDRIKQTMGDLFPEKGIVRHEEYEEAKRALSQIKERVIAQYATSEGDRRAWEAAWPFDG